jgi:hypothetical protein
MSAIAAHEVGDSVDGRIIPECIQMPRLLSKQG